MFALATAIARRASVRAGGRRLYPAFYLAFVERSTLYSKTGGLDVLRLLLDAAGLRHLLLPASFTPQALVADLALHVPQAVREAGPEERARWLERHRHAAQRASSATSWPGCSRTAPGSTTPACCPCCSSWTARPRRSTPT